MSNIYLLLTMCSPSRQALVKVAVKGAADLLPLEVSLYWAEPENRARLHNLLHNLLLPDDYDKCLFVDVEEISLITEIS